MPTNEPDRPEENQGNDDSKDSVEWRGQVPQGKAAAIIADAWEEAPDWATSDEVQDVALRAYRNDLDPADVWSGDSHTTLDAFEGGDE